MAVFRKVNTSFWQDPLVLDLTPEEKYFYLYLMTNTKTNQCGIYEIPKKVMEMETGYNSETIDKLIKRFIEYERILFSKDTNEIMILNWIKYNGSSSPKVLSRVETELKEIKCKEFVDKYIELSNGLNYKLDTLSILYPYSIDTQSQEEEEEEEEEEEDIDKEIETEEEEEEVDKIILTKELKEKIITEWNKLPVADVRTLSEARSKKIKILLQTYGEEDLFKAIDNINKSRFLQGINDRGWVITIDWFLKGNNFIKVLEGNYNKGKQHKQQAKKKGIYKANSDREEADYNKIANRFMEGL